MSSSGGGSGEKAPQMDENGKLINPHNPEFITKVPWYLGQESGPTLKHHNRQKDNHELSLAETDALISQKVAVQRNLAANVQRTAYRKGTCRNCGSSTHQEKDCLERPRSARKAAWKSGTDIAADDAVLDLQQHGRLSYAAKRDQWKGYDTREYQEVMEKHMKAEEDRRQQQEAEKEIKQAAKRNRRSKSDSAAQDGDRDDVDSDDDDDEDDDDNSNTQGDTDVKVTDSEARDFQGTLIPQGGLGGHGMRITSRNLRLREDTPKYLRNLALDSAFYDPKSRSMRANPYDNGTGTVNPESVPFAGDNFVRYTGEALELARNQVLCWEMNESLTGTSNPLNNNSSSSGGIIIDVVANPSQAEFLKRQMLVQQQEQAQQRQQAILSKYGDSTATSTGAASTAQKSLDPRLRLGQTEKYVEYDPRTSLPRTNAAANSTTAGGANGGGSSVVRTKYEEDQYPGNHTSVWGSFFCRQSAQWGFACCNSTLRRSVCTGEKGRLARQAPATRAPAATTTAAASTTAAPASTMAAPPAQAAKPTSLPPATTLTSSTATAAATAGGANSGSGAGSMYGFGGPQMTAEEMEVYQRQRVHADDPMAAYFADNGDGEEGDKGDKGGDKDEKKSKKDSKKKKSHKRSRSSDSDDDSDVDSGTDSRSDASDDRSDDDDSEDEKNAKKKAKKSKKHRKKDKKSSSSKKQRRD